jgi:N-acetylglucosaminyl-diphospho-decaprenol L-rhamnosyltransferase
MKPILSIIVLGYNTRDLVMDCARSVYDQTRETPFELLLVDNASTDGSVAAFESAFPKARVLAYDENLGFARAHNRALEDAQGSLFLLLNPDTVVLDKAVDRIVAAARQHPDIDIFGCSQFYPDGRRNTESCWSAPTPWSMLMLGTGLASAFRGSRLFNPESFGWWDWREPREVDIVSGSFLLIRAPVWRALGGFAPEFFMYGEDADLCLRARERGSRSMVVPDVRIVHIGGGSERARGGKLVRLFAAKQRLMSRHWPPARARFGVRMLRLWAGSRYAALSCAALLTGRARAARDAWAEVWRARSRWAAGEWS